LAAAEGDCTAAWRALRDLALQVYAPEVNAGELSRSFQGTAAHHRAYGEGVGGLCRRARASWERAPMVRVSSRGEGQSPTRLYR
jgi:hypothetical protein